MNRPLQTFTFGPFERIEQDKAQRRQNYLHAYDPGYIVIYAVFGFKVWTTKWRPL